LIGQGERDQEEEGEPGDGRDPEPGADVEPKARPPAGAVRVPA
jgi:hypothetical protein